MKILYINSGFRGGGAEKVARQLYYGMPKYGAETFFAAGHDRTNSADEVIYSSKWNSGWNELLYCLGGGIRLRDPFFKKKITLFIEREQIDIVHFHNIHGKYCGVEDIADIAKHCKTVWTLHDSWSVTGHCAHPIDCEQWVGGDCRWCGHMNLYPGAASRQKINQAFERKRRSYTGKNIVFVTPSQWLKDRVQKSILQGEKVRVIYNGIATEMAERCDSEKLREANGIARDKRVLLFIASDVKLPYKGYAYLEQALLALEEKEKYTILVIGKCGNLEGLDAALDVRYLGYISDPKEMNRFYSMADVFILPSIAETFPCVVLEAMANGTPVIAFEIGGIPEQVNDRNGWLVRERSAEKLKEAIEDAFLNPIRLKEKSRECKKDVLKYFTEEQMLEQYWKLYQEL